LVLLTRIRFHLSEVIPGSPLLSFNGLSLSDRFRNPEPPESPWFHGLESLLPPKNASTSSPRYQTSLPLRRRRLLPEVSLSSFLSPDRERARRWKFPPTVIFPPPHVVSNPPGYPSSLPAKVVFLRWMAWSLPPKSSPSPPPLYLNSPPFLPEGLPPDSLVPFLTAPPTSCPPEGRDLLDRSLRPTPASFFSRTVL